MDDTKKPTIEELTERLAAVESRVNKLDRLVYKLFEQLKRMTLQRTAN
jgi:uncharacterized coiled-coil protein SlyX